MKALGEKGTFFRQSSWMVLATVAGGVFMSAVHVVVNQPMLRPEYAVFSALLRVYLLMGFPAGGLQVVFAQQAAAAITEHEERRLSETVRAVLRGTLVIWLIMGAAVFFWRHEIISRMEISNPAALWVTVFLGLAALWMPVIRGLLQGRQNFAGLGWVMILDGVGRFLAIVLIVEMGGQAAGAMTGALIGQGVSFALGAWLVRGIIHGPRAAFDWGRWFNRVIPLTLGVGVVLFLSTSDFVFIQAVVSKEESPFYAPAAMIGLAMISFTTPLAAVMFPKVVQSAARIQKTDAVRHALMATALLGGAAAVACTLFPELPLRILYFRNRDYWRSAVLVPSFAWSLLPLILANVLISDLLARERFRIVPWMVAIAIGYACALGSLKDRLVYFTPKDVIDPQSLASQWRDHRDSLSAFIWNQLPPGGREILSQTNRSSAVLSPALTDEINRLLQGPPLYQPERFAGVHLSKETLKLVQAGTLNRKEETRFNRLLLQDAYPRALVPAATKMFAGFKLVVRTLGTASLVLLAVSLWFTYRQAPIQRPPNS